MIDQHAGQSVADGFVNQQRGNGRIHATGKSTQHAAIANLAPNLVDHFLAVGRHGPVAFNTDDVVHEIGKQLAAVRRVYDLGVEHGGVIFARLIRSDGEGGVFGCGDDFEAIWKLGDAIAVAHPDGVGFAGLPQAIKQL